MSFLPFAQDPLSSSLTSLQASPTINIANQVPASSPLSSPPTSSPTQVNLLPESSPLPPLTPSPVRTARSVCLELVEIPDLHDPVLEEALTDLQELVASDLSTIELAIQNDFERILQRVFKRLPGPPRHCQIRLLPGISLGQITGGEGFVPFRDTPIEKRYLRWRYPKSGQAPTVRSDISWNAGVKDPDISFTLVNSVTRAGIVVKIQSRSATMGIKPDGGNCAKGLAQSFMYALGAFEACGCYLGLSFHNGRYVRHATLGPNLIALVTEREEVGEAVGIDEVLVEQEAVRRHFW